jgi:hypothetical protein
MESCTFPCSWISIRIDALPPKQPILKETVASKLPSLISDIPSPLTWMDLDPRAIDGAWIALNVDTIASISHALDESV